MGWELGSVSVSACGMCCGWDGDAGDGEMLNGSVCFA